MLNHLNNYAILFIVSFSTISITNCTIKQEQNITQYKTHNTKILSSVFPMPNELKGYKPAKFDIIRILRIDGDDLYKIRIRNTEPLSALIKSGNSLIIILDKVEQIQLISDDGEITIQDKNNTPRRDAYYDISKSQLINIIEANYMEFIVDGIRFDLGGKFTKRQICSQLAEFVKI